MLGGVVMMVLWTDTGNGILYSHSVEACYCHIAADTSILHLEEL